MDHLIVVGLGNPGAKYEDTRHNVGFKVIDELCRRFKKRLRSGKGDYLLASAIVERHQLRFVKPVTYMNESGSAVVDVLDAFEATEKNLVVVSDDFALPLGTLRIRARGSDGGHNGLASIIHQLGSNSFIRIRCGIGQETMPAKDRMAEFVLSRFESREVDLVNEMVRKAADASVAVSISGVSRTMNTVNS